MEKLKILDLFSGIGGFSLGLERTGGFETVAFCEIEPFPIKVLNKHWPDVPVYNDVRTLDYDGSVDVICGGYPCQPFSVAGERKGKEDDRHLWPAMFKLVQKHRPTWVIGENVAGHVTMGLDDVLADLESSGYTVRTFVIPAVACDAKHRRDRTWIVANANGTPRARGGIPVRVQPSLKSNSGSKQVSGIISNTNSGGREGQGQPIEPINSTQNKDREAGQSGSMRKRQAWEVEPSVGRVAHGIPDASHRLKALGNAVVPQIVEVIGNAILGTYNAN
jgi:DNA (cytosine-5)-methyltransferase 1|tara:strand:+ start:125 stop:955 length:831 start_codon:yes stop_codon:yes gene_type:complete